MLQDTKILNGLYTSTHMTFQRRWNKVVPSSISSPRRREFYITEAPFTEPRRQDEGLRTRLSNLWYGSQRRDEGGQSFPPPPIITEERELNLEEPHRPDDIFVKNVQVCQRQKQLPRRDLNPGLPAYELGVLTSAPRTIKLLLLAKQLALYLTKLLF